MLSCDPPCESQTTDVSTRVGDFVKLFTPTLFDVTRDFVIVVILVIVRASDRHRTSIASRGNANLPATASMMLIWQV